MPVPTALRHLSAAVLLAASTAAPAQSTPAPPDTRPSTQDTATPAADPATATTRIDVADDVTLTTRVVDPALVRASRAFDALDADGDGMLEAAEASREPALGADFGAVDADGSGRIDRDEYTARLRR